LRYRSHLESRQLAPGTINLRLGAVRRLAYEAADCGLLSSDLAAGVRRVKGVKKLGMRLGRLAARHSSASATTARSNFSLWRSCSGASIPHLAETMRSGRRRESQAACSLFSLYLLPSPLF